MTATTKGIEKEKNKYSKKNSQRPSSSLVAKEPIIDFNDSN
jgi:hypothetical protein